MGEITLTRFRYQIRKEVGRDSDDYPDDDVDEHINYALWELEDKFPFEVKETLFTTSLVEGQSEYSLSGLTTLDYLYSVATVNDEGVREKLARMTRDWFDNNVDQDDDEGWPQRYLRENKTLTIWPPPDSEADGENLELALRTSVASLAAGADTTGLPRNWDEILLHGAIWRAWKSFGDYAQAQQAYNFQIGLIRNATPTEAKEERDSRYARLDVIWEFPEEVG